MAASRHRTAAVGTFWKQVGAIVIIVLKGKALLRPSGWA